MNTNIDYLRELRTDLERLAATHPDPRSINVPANEGGVLRATRGHWRVTLVLVVVAAAIVPVAAFAGVSPVGWLHGLLGTSEPIAPRTVVTGHSFGQVTVNHGTVVQGGTPGQRELLSGIVRGIDGRLVPIVRIGPPPRGIVVRHHLRRPGVTWLYFPFPAAEGVASDLAEWETRLVAGAFRDGSVRRGLPNVIGATQPYPRFGPSSEGFFGPNNPAIRDGNAGRLTKLLLDHLHAMGLTPLSIRFAQPNGLAPIVIAQTRDPHARLGVWKPHGWPIADNHYEGLFFEIVNTTGMPVYFYAHTTRVEGGSSSTGHGPFIPVTHSP